MGFGVVSKEVALNQFDMGYDEDWCRILNRHADMSTKPLHADLGFPMKVPKLVAALISILVGLLVGSCSVGVPFTGSNEVVRPVAENGETIEVEAWLPDAGPDLELSHISTNPVVGDGSILTNRNSVPSAITFEFARSDAAAAAVRSEDPIDFFVAVCVEPVDAPITGSCLRLPAEAFAEPQPTRPPGTKRITPNYQLEIPAGVLPESIAAAVVMCMSLDCAPAMLEPVAADLTWN